MRTGRRHVLSPEALAAADVDAATLLRPELGDMELREALNRVRRGWGWGVGEGGVVIPAQTKGWVFAVCCAAVFAGRCTPRESARHARCAAAPAAPSKSPPCVFPLCLLTAPLDGATNRSHERLRPPLHRSWTVWTCGVRALWRCSTCGEAGGGVGDVGAWEFVSIPSSQPN